MRPWYYKVWSLQDSDVSKELLVYMIDASFAMFLPSHPGMEDQVMWLLILVSFIFTRLLFWSYILPLLGFMYHSRLEMEHQIPALEPSLKQLPKTWKLALSLEKETRWLSVFSIRWVTLWGSKYRLPIWKDWIYCAIKLTAKALNPVNVLCWSWCFSAFLWE